MFSLKKNITTSNQKVGFKTLQTWFRCHQCKETCEHKEWKENLQVCPKCQYHYRLSSKDRIQLLVDEGSFVEEKPFLKTNNPLNFETPLQSYSYKLKQQSETTGLHEAIICGTAKIDMIPIEIAIMDFNFFGGSMGIVVGEKFIRSIKQAIKFGRSMIAVSSSGGARMQEGILSLMQMTKTCNALLNLNKKKILFISILTDPTMGGVSASFSSLGDILIAEPNALIGFTGPRVIEQTIRQKLPSNFQKSEYLLQHGFIDTIVHRKKMKQHLMQLLHFFNKK